MNSTRPALLFDIDGTMADTDALHLEAFNEVFAPFGHAFDHAHFVKELQGFSMASIRQRFLGHLPEPDQLRIMEEKERAYRRRAAGGISPTPGLMALLDMAEERNVPVAAVTNAPRANAEMMLDGLGIRHRFGALIIGDELEQAKPHPLPYLKGLRLLGGDAAKSVAFEDSRSGVQSATAAGIAAVGIRTSVDHAGLVAAGAVASAVDFNDPILLEFVQQKLGRRL